jgi:phosphate:Na+ symporter
VESGNSLLLFGGLAFFLYGMQLAREGLQQAAGSRLRSALGVLAGNRFSGLALGAGVTVVLQSSSATTVMLVGFASARLMTLTQVMAVILGADIGTTVTVQLIAFNMSDFALILVALGAAGVLFARSKRTRHLAEIALGFGMIFYGMKLMADSTAPLRHDQGFRTIMAVADERPLLALFAAAVFTGIVQSSAATIGLVLSLAQADTIGLPASVAAMLGANIGTCVTALLGRVGAGHDGRRVAVGHLLFKVLGVALIWPFLAPFCELAAGSADSLSRQIANAHTFFNVGISAVFLPFVGLAARALTAIVPAPAAGDEGARFGPRYLDPNALKTPPLAIGNATREVIRMADGVETMLSTCLDPFTFEKGDTEATDALEALDDRIDTLDREIKLYIAETSGRAMSDASSRRAQMIVSFTNDLEHVGDIISNNIVEVARKKQRKGYSFSSEGFGEIADFHAKVLENFKLAVSCFTTEDEELAQTLLRHKKSLARLADDLRESHMDRLRRGLPETRETTSLHLDLISHMRWINSSVSNIAFAVVRRSGAQKG